MMYNLNIGNEQLPIKINSDNEYYSSLKKTLNEYQDSVKAIESEFIDVYKNVQYNIKSIIRSLEYYYNSQLEEAKKEIYNILEKYMNNEFVVSNIDKSYAFKGMAPFENITRTGTKEKYDIINNTKLKFFKGRVAQSAFYEFSKEEMLHIPFNKRELVTTQRFSIPGIPCLYFGTTSYICWIELDKPDMNVFNISSYDLPSNLKILNLVVPIGLIYGMCNNMKSEADRILAQTLIEIWPLVCATSYKVKEVNRNFKSEYIVSQIIMQCMKELGVDGVAYFSKKTPFRASCHFSSVNLAILCTYNGKFKSGQIYSPICNNIKFCKPINVAEFLLLPENERTRFIETNNLVFDENIMLAQNRFRYKNSPFGKLDNYLSSLEHEDIKAQKLK